jgi:hypothetical protein
MGQTPILYALTSEKARRMSHETLMSHNECDTLKKMLEFDIILVGLVLIGFVMSITMLN